jgi:hypothetical protein
LQTKTLYQNTKKDSGDNNDNLLRLTTKSLWKDLTKFLIVNSPNGAVISLNKLSLGHLKIKMVLNLKIMLHVCSHNKKWHNKNQK